MGVAEKARRLQHGRLAVGSTPMAPTLTHLDLPWPTLSRTAENIASSATAPQGNQRPGRTKNKMRGHLASRWPGTMEPVDPAPGWMTMALCNSPHKGHARAVQPSAVVDVLMAGRRSDREAAEQAGGEREAISTSSHW